jgi:hypothetical protein
LLENDPVKKENAAGVINIKGQEYGNAKIRALKAYNYPFFYAYIKRQKVFEKGTRGPYKGCRGT